MEFDEEKAKEIVGSHILVGITYLDKNGELESLVQFHGEVLSALISAFSAPQTLKH